MKKSKVKKPRALPKPEVEITVTSPNGGPDTKKAVAAIVILLTEARAKTYSTDVGLFGGNPYLHELLATLEDTLRHAVRNAPELECAVRTAFGESEDTPDDADEPHKNKWRT